MLTAPNHLIRHFVIGETTSIMKNLCLLLLLLWGAIGCNPDGTPPPPGGAFIELDGQNWDYSNVFALIATAGTPGWQHGFVKIDGADGSFLYVYLPVQYLSAIPSAPYTLNGQLVYYSDGTVNSTIYEGQGPIEILAYDSTAHKISLRFNGTLTQGQSGQSIHVQSSDLEGIAFNVIAGGNTTLNYQVQKLQEDWHVSEPGADMILGRVDWFLLNRVLTPEEKLVFNIPWGLAPGTYNLTGPNSPMLKFYQGNPLAEWSLVSGKITLETNDFNNAKQRGTLEGVFKDPFNPSQTVELKAQLFETGFAF